MWGSTRPEKHRLARDLRGLPWAPVTQNAISLGGVMVVFAGLGALAIAFIYRFLPETKGLPVEEIVRLFEQQQQQPPEPAAVAG
jgi:Sugar (and other) transporter